MTGSGWTHRLIFVEVEHGRAEILLTFAQDLVGGGSGVGRRRVVEGGHFGNENLILRLYPRRCLLLLRETTSPTRKVSEIFSV